MSVDHPTSPPERLRKPHENDALWLLRRIWDRVNRKNMHFMAALVGREGAGKSYTAMKIASEIDPTFDADRVIFDVADLLHILKDREHQPGQFYVLDEAGVQLGKRRWQERSQILVNQCLQLIRNHNLGLIFTLPRLGELDSQAQGRLQAFYEITDKEDGEHVRGKWKWLDPDRTDQTGKVYKPFPRRRVDGFIRRLTSVAFTPPPAGLVEPYETAKLQFQEQFYEETLEELEDQQDGEGEEQHTPAEVLEELRTGEGLEAVVSFHGTTGEPYIDADLVQFEYGLSVRDARQVKKVAEKSDELDLSSFE